MSEGTGLGVLTIRWNFEVPVALDVDVKKKLRQSQYVTRAELVRSLVRTWLQDDVAAEPVDVSEGTKG